nr:MAG TPA: Protein of unknown function (DUF551) [Caudoviricetes sp.]
MSYRLQSTAKRWVRHWMPLTNGYNVECGRKVFMF